MRPAGACAECRRRSWLLGALAGHLDRPRARTEELLRLPDGELIAAVAGSDDGAVLRAWRGFDARVAAWEGEAAGLAAVCGCDRRYPARLRELPTPPAILHLAGVGGLVRLGELGASDAVAIVGARRASAYGREVAHRLAAGIGAAGLAVVSGMALGIDGAAHEGALAAGAMTVAVLPGGADLAYPASHRGLHRRITGGVGLAVSELGPGVRPRRWMFTARNRIIAALAGMTVVVQARTDSGALLTARWARRLGRALGAVPGPITTPLSAGPHGLIAGGAQLVSGPESVLDALVGVEGGSEAGLVGVEGRPEARPRRSPLEPQLQRLLDALADGEPTELAFVRAGLAADAGLAALAALELAGAARRGAGGRYGVS